jgi:putative transcriptional regulator
MSRPSRSKPKVAGALCALLLLFSAAHPLSGADTKPLTAILLVARAELPDPDFADSAVLVMNNLGASPAGLIINRPTKIAVAELFPALKRLASLPDKVYFGGPVQLSTVWFLFRATTAPRHAVQACDGLYVSMDRALLMQLLDREHPMDGLRIFAGHSGWGPGQLEAEIARGDWSLQRAESSTIFNRANHPWPAPRGPKNST